MFLTLNSYSFIHANTKQAGDSYVQFVVVPEPLFKLSVKNLDSYFTEYKRNVMLWNHSLV
jgi:hypothetical protein